MSHFLITHFQCIVHSMFARNCTINMWHNIVKFIVNFCIHLLECINYYTLLALSFHENPFNFHLSAISGPQRKFAVDANFLIEEHTARKLDVQLFAHHAAPLNQKCCTAPMCSMPHMHICFTRCTHQTTAAACGVNLFVCNFGFLLVHN